MAARREATAALTLALLLTAATLSAAAPVLTTAPRKGLGKDFPANPFCPWDAVKFGGCVGVLGYVSAQLGSKCCQLVG